MLIPFIDGSSRRQGRSRARPGLFVLAALCLFACSDPGPESAGHWVKAGPMEIPCTLTEIGEVVSERVTTVRAPSGGEVIWLIAEGTEVKPGDVLARFNSEDIEEALANQEREVEAARQSLAKEEENLRSKRQEMKLETEKKRLEVKAAELALEQLLKEATEELILKGEVNLERAEFDEKEAEMALERVRRLRKAGVASGQEVIDAEDALKNKRIEKRKAAETLKVVKEGPDPRLVAEARLKIEQAKKACQRQIEIEKETVALYESQVRIARANLDKADRSLQYSRTELENCTVRAGVAGRAVFHRVWKGDENQSRIEVGETLNRNAEILKIADLENLRLRFPVNEVDLNRVELGRPAQVRLLGIPGAVFKGKLVQLGDVAWDKNKRLGDLALMQAGEAGVAVVDAEVTLEQENPQIRLGFTGEVTIHLAPLEVPVAVPATSVRMDRAGPVVRVKGEGDRLRPIEIGRGWGDWVSISRGLEPGEEVFVRD